MKNYKIVSFKDGIVSLEVDRARRDYPVPVIDGLYPEGKALEDILDEYASQLAKDTIEEDRVKSLSVAKNPEAIMALVVPPPAEKQIAKILIQRTILLGRTDWTQMPDNSMPILEKEKWANYRQQLRDITAQVSFPSVVWPVPPSVVKLPNGTAVTSQEGIPISLDIFLRSVL